MDISKERLVNISAPLLGLATGIAATIGPKLMESSLHDVGMAGVGIAGGIAVNLLSNVAQNICSAVRKKVFIRHPDQLNHDLQKAILASVDDALDNITRLYKEQNPRKKDIRLASAFTDSVQITVKQLFSEPRILQRYDTLIESYFQAPIEEAQAKIFTRLREALGGTRLPRGFLVLLETRFTEQLRLCFAERLKDKENPQGWIAFQKMMLEGTKKDLEELLQGQNQIISRLDDLKKEQTFQNLTVLTPGRVDSVQSLLREINQPARIQVQLDRALNDLLHDLRQELIEIKQLGRDHRDALASLRSDLRVSWWNRKVVLLCGIVAALAVTVILVGHHYSGQPFMVDVVVHGPKGVNDLVLQNRGTVLLHYGDNTQRQVLNEKGEVLFRQIPGEYANDSVLISVVELGGDPYRPACDSCLYKLEPAKTIYIQVNPYGLDKLNGVVVDEQNKPLKDATVIVHGLRKLTDKNGWFEFQIPADKQERWQNVMVAKEGYIEETVEKVPLHVQSKPLEIQLRKR